jgi:hypothetical protein
MNKGTDDSIPNPGAEVSDETEPAEEYELDQLADQRADTRGQSLEEQLDEKESRDEGSP